MQKKEMKTTISWKSAFDDIFPIFSYFITSYQFKMETSDVDPDLHLFRSIAVTNLIFSYRNDVFSSCYNILNGYPDMGAHVWRELGY